MARPKNVGDQVLALVRAGVPYKKIAAQLGVSPGTVGYHGKKIKPGRNGYYDRPEVQAFYDAGHTKNDCVERFGLAKSTLRNWVSDGKFILRDVDRSRSKLSTLDYALLYQGNRSDGFRSRFRARIIKEGLIPYRCAICGITEWNGAALTLTLDHTNGHSGDHRMDNMRFLCPNCDSQQPTYCYRNRGRYAA